MKISVRLFTILVFLAFFMSNIASATSDNISILTPQDNQFADPQTSDFVVTAHITDQDITQAVAKIATFPTQYLTKIQGSAYDWRTTMAISSIPDGTYSLVVGYFNSSGNIAGTQTISITTQKPAPPVQYGAIQFTIKDTNNNPAQGVTVSPGGNITDSNGNVFVGGQPLNKNISFTFTKNSYNTTLFYYTFTNNLTVSQPITIGKVGGDMKDLIVSGYEDMTAGRGTFIKATDSAGVKVDDAEVAIYDSNNVKSIPGVTVNGRIFVSIAADSGAGQYLIEVTKPGYNDYTDTFQIWAAPKPSFTPTPTATPTPTPTPEGPQRTWRPDMGASLTDDEYNTMQAWKTSISATPTPAKNTTSSQDNTAIYVLFGGVFAYGVYKNKTKIIKTIKRSDKINIETNPTTATRPAAEKSTDVVDCPHCEWEIPGDGLDEKSKDFIKKQHLKNEHQHEYGILQLKEKPALKEDNWEKVYAAGLPEAIKNISSDVEKIEKLLHDGVFDTVSREDVLNFCKFKQHEKLPKRKLTTAEANAILEQVKKEVFEKEQRESKPALSVDQVIINSLAGGMREKKDVFDMVSTLYHTEAGEFNTIIKRLAENGLIDSKEPGMLTIGENRQ
jgi:hypothetical protein